MAIPPPGGDRTFVISDHRTVCVIRDKALLHACSEFQWRAEAIQDLQIHFSDISAELTRRQNPDPDPEIDVSTKKSFKDKLRSLVRTPSTSAPYSFTNDDCLRLAYSVLVSAKMALQRIGEADTGVEDEDELTPMESLNEMWAEMLQAMEYAKTWVKGAEPFIGWNCLNPSSTIDLIEVMSGRLPSEVLQDGMKNVIELSKLVSNDVQSAANPVVSCNFECL